MGVRGKRIRWRCQIIRLRSYVFSLDAKVFKTLPRLVVFDDFHYYVFNCSYHTVCSFAIFLDAREENLFNDILRNDWY